MNLPESAGCQMAGVVCHESARPAPNRRTGDQSGDLCRARPQLRQQRRPGAVHAPERRHAIGRVSGMTAPLEVTRRQLRVSWQGWHSTFATGLHYRASAEVTKGVGCPAMGAKRHSVGRVTSTIALLALSTPACTPRVRDVLPPTRH